MTDELELRQLRPRDGNALAAFFEENARDSVTATFDPFPLDAQTALDLLRPSRQDRFFGAYWTQRLVGFSMLRGWDEGYEIPSFGILVANDFQGRGIGRRLTAWTLDRARDAGAAHVRLSVYGSNPAAHHIYVALGFVESSREPVSRHGGRDVRIVMIKELREDS